MWSLPSLTSLPINKTIFYVSNKLVFNDSTFSQNASFYFSSYFFLASNSLEFESLKKVFFKYTFSVLIFIIIII